MAIVLCFTILFFIIVLLALNLNRLQYKRSFYRVQDKYYRECRRNKKSSTPTLT